MKELLQTFLAYLFPYRVKKLLFNSWHKHDDRFWLYARQLGYSPSDLYRPRFHWDDLDASLGLVRQRFGAVDIFLLSDRPDLPHRTGLRLEYVSQPEKLLASQGPQTLVLCAYESDEKLLRALRLLQTKPNIFYYGPVRTCPTARYFHRNEIAWKALIDECEMDRGKFDLGDYENIIQALDITRDLEGAYVEIGVYKGGSASLALRYLKNSKIKRKAYFLDLFDGMINAPAYSSQDAAWAGSHAETSMDAVARLLSGYSDFELMKCDIIKDSLPGAIKSIAACNIDVDIYEATLAALMKCGPLVQPGGIMICEDQGHTPFLAGAYLAIVEFLDCGTGKGFVPIHMASGQIFLVKK